MSFGQCNVTIGQNMRLGSMGGAGSAHAMYVTSCTLKIESIGSTAISQWERQQFGFDNSPSVADDDPGNAVECTATSGGNVNCWLAWLEDKPGWFTGDNSPVVVTQGTNSNDCRTP